jgi:hypothetical protein
LGIFDPVEEFMLLCQTFINYQALNEVILNRMVQIHQDMGWNIPVENFAPARGVQINRLPPTEPQPNRHRPPTDLTDKIQFGSRKRIF